eukprot:m.114677 g.114677  ORF g.114677 m.114677 type:complete len:617 (-) comp16308_c0_seq2:75-1925(-)
MEADEDTGVEQMEVGDEYSESIATGGEPPDVDMGEVHDGGGADAGEDGVDGGNHEGVDNVYAAALQRLSEPDAIMEADVVSAIGEFVKAGGSPQTLISVLSENYQGFALMANLLAEWLALAGEDAATVTTLMEDHIKDLVSKSFDVSGADAIFDHPDMDTSWLKELIRYPSWRSLIYELSAHHKHSLMLNLAIKRIADAGFYDEIATVETASTQIEVYSSVVAELISNMMTVTEEQLGQRLPEFTQAACFGQHTFLYTQSLLHAVMQQPRGLMMKRLLQEVQAEATERGHDVLHYGLWFDRSSGDQAVGAALESTLHKKALAPADVAVLYDQYSGPTPPSPELLRIPDLLDLFISELFTPSKASSNVFPDRDKYTFILATAVSMPAVATESSSQKRLDTVAALEKVLVVLGEGNLHASGIAVLFEFLHFPVVSKGLLHWINVTLKNDAFFAMLPGKVSDAPPHLSLVDEIARQHRLLQATVFSLLSDAFLRQYQVSPLEAVELKRMILDRLIHTLSLGHVLPVLHFVRDHIGRNDLSLVMYFTLEIIKLAGAPLSVPFAEAMLQIVSRDDVVAGFRKKTSSHGALAGFFSDIERTKGLNEESRQSLTHLKSVFRRR